MNYLEAKTTEELCRALGLPDSHAPRVEMRRDLVIAIRRIIKRKGWTHAEAARRAGMGRTVITAIVNGNLARISTDKLINAAHGLGLSLKLRVA